MQSYRVCYGYGGVSRHRKLASLTPPMSPRKQRPQLKGIERILLIIQYPVVNRNVTTLLNSHPNLAIAYDSQLLDKAADVIYHNDSQLLMEDNDVIIDQLRRLSTQVEKKYVKVIGESIGLTLKNSKFQRTFQSHLKMMLNVFHLPVSVVFVNTAPLLRDQQAGLDRLKNNIIMMARTTDVSALTLDIQQLSPDVFMERICTFLRLNCSLSLEAVSW